MVLAACAELMASHAHAAAMPAQRINQSINVTPVAMKLKKLMPAIH
jgi:hypothetical protein